MIIETKSIGIISAIAAIVGMIIFAILIFRNSSKTNLWQKLALLWVSMGVGIIVFLCFFLPTYIFSAEVIIVDQNITEEISYRRYYLIGNAKIPIGIADTLDTKQMSGYSGMKIIKSDYRALIVNRADESLVVAGIGYVPESSDKDGGIGKSIIIGPSEYKIFKQDIEYFFLEKIPPETRYSSTGYDIKYWLLLLSEYKRTFD